MDRIWSSIFKFTSSRMNHLRSNSNFVIPSILSVVQRKWIHHYKTGNCLDPDCINTNALPSENNRLLFLRFFSLMKHRGKVLRPLSSMTSCEANTFKWEHCYKNDVCISNKVFFHHTVKYLDSWETTDKTINMKDMVRNILEATQRIDVMAGSVAHSDVEHLINELLSYGFEPESIQQLLSGKLWLLQQPGATLAMCQLLLDHGMTPNLVCMVIQDVPFSYQKDLNFVPEQINKTLFFLRNFGFTEREIYHIAGVESSALYVDLTSLRLNIARIKGLFPTKDTKKVICKSPNILWDDWSTTQAKFDYCIFNMGYFPSDIVKSHLFSHSLHKIQDRHIFLHRSGIFKVVNKKLDPSLNPNPPLKQVVDSSDFAFVKMVEGVGLKDYDVYLRMREMERDAEESDEEENVEDDEENLIDGWISSEDNYSSKENDFVFSTKKMQTGYKNKKFKKKLKKFLDRTA